MDILLASYKMSALLVWSTVCSEIVVF